jgi:hypothetical protein
VCWVSVWSGRKFVVYYESRKQELKIRLMNGGRCDERLKTRVEESTCLTYTGFFIKKEGIKREINRKHIKVSV